MADMFSVPRVAVNTGREEDTNCQCNCVHSDLLTFIYLPALQSIHASPGLEVHNGMFSFLHALNGLLQPTG